MTETAPQTPRLLSFLDAMCSWCYAFSPVMNTIADHFGDRLQYLTFAGGLRPFNTQPMTPELRETLEKTYAQISEMTGLPLKPAWMENPDFIYDTEPASRAVVTMRFLKPEIDFFYYLTIQRAFYSEGVDITKPAVLASQAEQFGVSPEEFLEAFNSDSIKEATMSDFRVAQNFNITGFPTLLIHRLDGKNQNAMLLVGQGFAPASEMIERIEAALSAEV